MLGTLKSSNENINDKESVTDYEEFRQAGIISKKFSSAVNTSQHGSTDNAVGEFLMASMMNR